MAQTLSQSEVADRLNVCRMTLYRWRKKGEGPPYKKVGGKIFYPAAKFEEWLNDTDDGTESEDADARTSA